MNKKKKLPQIILTSLIIGIILCMSIGLSIWLITDRIEIKPELGAEEIIKKYMDKDNAPYDGNILLPSSTELGLDMNSEDLTYYYKKADSQGDYTKVDVKNKLGPINAGEYLIKVEYVVSEDTNPDDDIDDSVIATIEDLTFTILKCKINITNLSFEGKTVTYDRKITNNIQVSGEIPSTIKKINYSCNEQEFFGATDAGTYNVKATFEYDTVNYEIVKLVNEQYVSANDYLEATLQINKKNIALATLSFEDNPNNIFYETNTGDIESTFVVTDNDGTVLEKDKDYTVVFSDIINLGNNHKVTVTGNKNYEGTKELTYSIQAKLVNLVITANNSQGAAYQILTYNGEIQRPSVTVTDGNGTTVTGATLSYDIDTKDQGLYKVNVTASKDGYTSTTKEVTILIKPATVTLSWTWSTIEYDGQPHNPTVNASGIFNDGYNVGVELTDPQVNAGNYTATANLKNNTLGNYELASDTYNFSISKRKISLDKAIYPLVYNQNVRTWEQVKSATLGLLTFDRVISGDTLGHSILGMHNGIYSYGTSAMANLDTSMTNVVGSTYQVSISITNTNYQLTKNTFVLKYQTVVISNGSYLTIEDAIASSSDLTLLGNVTSDSSYVVTSFTKLTLAQGNPYTEGNKVKTTYTLSKKLKVPYDGGSKDYVAEWKSTKTSYVYSALYIPEGITITVSGDGNVVVGAVLDQFAYVKQRGVIMNHGIMDFEDGTELKAYGFVKGTGTIKLNSGAYALDVFWLKNFPGADESKAIVDGGAFPVTQWTAHNISCETYIYKGALYDSMSYVVMVSGAVKKEITNLYIVGKGDNEDDKCMFMPSPGADSGSYMRKYTEIPNDSFIVSNQVIGQHAYIYINGNYQDSVISISINTFLANVSFSTSPDVSVPLDYYHINVEKGTLTLSKSSYALLSSNCSMTVNAGATLNIVASKEGTPYVAFLGGATLILNGTLKGNGYFGGKISTNNKGAIAMISNFSKDGIILRDGVDTVKSVSASSTAMMLNSEGEVVETALSSGSAYISTDHPKDSGSNVFIFEGSTNPVYTYTIEFDTLGGDPISSISTSIFDTSYIVDKDNIPDANKLHYEFSHWYYLDANSQKVTLDKYTLTNTNTSIKLYAEYTYKKYKFSYSIAYGVTPEGTPNFIDSNTQGLVFANKFDAEFTVEVFNNGDLAIPTTVTYNNIPYSTYWYLGIDKSTGYPLTSITKAQFDIIAESIRDGNEIPLYGEFADVPFYTVKFRDSKHGLITQNFVLLQGQSITSVGGIVYPFDSTDIDTNPEEPFYNNGFKDQNGNVYTLEEVMQLTITSDMTIEIFWDNKFVVTYDDPINNDSSLYVMPGQEIIFEDRDDKFEEGTNYDTDSKFVGWYYSEDDKVYAPGKTININADTTFVARYDTLYTYQIEIVPNNSTVSFTFNGETRTVNNDSTEKIFKITSTTNDVSFDISFTITANSNYKIDSVKSEIAGNVETLSSSYKITFNAHTVITVSTSWDGGCIAEGTLVTLADGMKVPVESLTGSELLLVWNHMTGKMDVAKIAYIVDHDKVQKEHEVLTMYFDDETYIKIIGEHVFYDATLNKYVAIDSTNYHEFINHKFLKNMHDKNVVEIEFIKAAVNIEVTRAFEVVTDKHLINFANDILSTSAYLDPLLNVFDINDETYAYNVDQMLKDIEEYGLYTYKDFEGLIDEKAFELYNAAYLKVAVGKGYITWDDIIELINIYYNNDVNPLT